MGRLTSHETKKRTLSGVAPDEILCFMLVRWGKIVLHWGDVKGVEVVAAAC